MHQTYRPVFLLFLGFLMLAAAAPAHAALDSSAESAFRFAERKNWSDARAHARRTSASGVRALTEWRYVHDQDSGAEFDEITAFATAHPDWPKPERLKLRAEQSLRFSEPSLRELRAWFEQNPPVSGFGKIKFAEMLMKEGTPLTASKVQDLIREGWHAGDFDEPEEKRILAVYGDLLREQDHAERADRLLWEEKTRPATRILDLLPKAQRPLARARIALIDDKNDASFHVSQVTPANLKDPGLLYARMQYRAKRDDDDGVRELLLAAPATVPHPEKWWRQRELQVRKAIDERNYKLAGKLLANHSQTEGQEQADAVWLAGWLALEFLNKPQEAYAQFYKMYEAVRFPVSKARAAYWAGRAAEKGGDAASGQNWYTTASSFPTTFYGQLATLKLLKKKSLSLPADPSPDSADKRAFDANELVQGARAAAEAREFDLASALFNHLIDTSVSPQQASLAAEMASDVHSTMLGVRAAKRALQRNVVLLSIGYPRLKLSDLPIETPLAHAIVRQESEFDPSAKSRSGAIGMMQLLPSTARETARKAGISYTESKLYDIPSNIRLGSAYLSRLINAYDGSYIQAVAAYNAGPGRVREWRNTFGTPGNSVDSAVNWIEKIPFVETRNYVQRVMENLQVYRHLIGKDDLSLGEDLTRGQ